MATTEPTVWTLKEFKKFTTPFNPAKRGRDFALQAVDQRLEDFESQRTLPWLDARQEAAYFLVHVCRWYLEGKKTKTSSTSAMRRQGVSALAKQAWEYLQYCKFAERKALGANGALRAMGPGYTPERTLYVNANKAQNPISGSYMHEALSDARSNFLGKSFGQLTDQDYQTLDNMFQGNLKVPDPSGLLDLEVRRRVHFLNKQERIKRLLMVFRGKFYNGFDSKFTTFGTQAYVIDEYGNFYSTNESFGTDVNFNHSTFNAGKDVICAGTLTVAQGELRNITNKSGHYKPTRQNLHNALVSLDSQELDLTNCVVTVSEPDLARPGKLIEHDYDHANVFVTNMNAAPSRSVPQP